MDLERYFELRTILQRWRMTLAESIRRRIEASPRLARRLERLYGSEGADEPFSDWLDRWCRQAAIQFILRILFLRVLEDRELLGATRIRTSDGQRMWAQLTRNLGASSYVQFCFWDAAHLLPDLFEPTDYDLVLPADDLVQRFLDDVWRRPDPDRPGWLRFDFRPLPSAEAGRDAGSEGDPGFQTRFIGDLYQELDAEIRERYALLQTPDFISQFILENTLLKRFEEVDYREVTLIDPTCGSGHFLVDAFWMFVAKYEAANPQSETANRKSEIAREIIERHLFGCDINPYATALTRFRLVLAACDYARPASLRDFRDLRFNIVTIDSLIPYEKLMAGGVQAGTATARALGQPEAIERALPVLRRRYHVVVGNPPYILAQDPTKRELYREHYVSAYSKFGLSAPFTERFLNLAIEGGHVGLINSNAFARRQFGSKLIEEVLPKYDLQAVIDLSGAYVPGHGTPTLILLARKQLPASDSVLVVSNLKGEPTIPADPAQGHVWQSVLRAFVSGPGFSNENADAALRPRMLLGQHPWQFGGPRSRLYDKLLERCTRTVRDITEAIGFDIITGADDIYIISADYARRARVPNDLLRPIIRGEQIRDWSALESEQILFPYTTDLQTLSETAVDQKLQVLHPYRAFLADRRQFGQTATEAGLKWYEYRSFYKSKRANSRRLIAFAEISTHAQFLPFDKDILFPQTAPIIKLRADESADYNVLAGLLSSSTVDFLLKQTCFSKASGEDPIRDRYVHASNYVAAIPLPGEAEFNPSSRRLLALANEIVGLSKLVPRLSHSKVFERNHEAYQAWNSCLCGYEAPHPELPPPFRTARELRSAREQLIALRQDIRGRMIFLQEEMDWLAYEMYGLIKKAPLAEDYLSESQYRVARLELGQRAFELAGKGYTGDWPPGYRPAPLPEYLRPLTEARIALIRSNPDIALLEDPLYKRRWVPPDYDKEFREAAAWWLAEKLEWALEQAGRPLSLREWARLMGQDERVNATLEVLTGSPSFDLEAELLKVIRANAVPNRPEHYLKASGLRKLYAARNTEYALRNMGDTETPPPVPEFSREDFSDATAWRLRGKLNIPRERFIYYAEFDAGRGNSGAPESGGPWFGWAGWDAARRADALAYLLDRAQRAGWEVRWRQCGLRAALRDLLPELKDLPAADRAEFESIAGICGIGLSATCYCQAYRDAFARGEAGVPGVGEEALGVKVVTPEEVRRPAGRGRKKKGETPAQLGLELR